MSELTLVEIRRQTRELVGDLGINSDTWTDTQVNEAIDWACNEIARRTACTYRESSPSSLGGGKFTIPAKSIRLIRAKDSAGRLLDKTDHFFESLKDPDWESSTSTTNPGWYQMDGATIKIVRSVSATLTAGYIERPDVMVDDTDTPDARIYEYFHPLLKYAAANWLFQTDGDQQDLGKADKMLSEFNSLIGAGERRAAESSIQE